MTRRATILAAGLLLLASPSATAQTKYEKEQQEQLRQVVSAGNYNFSSAWGELFYGTVYETEFIVNNECLSPQVVFVLFVDLPYLTIEGVPMPAGSITVPPGETRYPAKITTPPPPKLPVLDPNAVRMFPHGIFEEIKGAYRLEHQFVAGCLQNLETVAVEGHVHFDPNAGGDKSPGDPCARWWNTGEKPAGASDATCLQRIRDLARTLRETVLGPLVAGDPAVWGWVPSVPEIGTMSIEALLAMKARADGGLAAAGSTDAVR